jgi:hypothetical protein
MTLEKSCCALKVAGAHMDTKDSIIGVGNKGRGQIGQEGAISSKQLASKQSGGYQQHNSKGTFGGGVRKANACNSRGKPEFGS